MTSTFLPSPWFDSLGAGVDSNHAGSKVTSPRLERRESRTHGPLTPSSQGDSLVKLVIQVSASPDQEAHAKVEAAELSLSEVQYERDLLAHQLNLASQERSKLRAQLRDLARAALASEREGAYLRQQAAEAAAAAAAAHALAAQQAQVIQSQAPISLGALRQQLSGWGPGEAGQSVTGQSVAGQSVTGDGYDMRARGCVRVGEVPQDEGADGQGSQQGVGVGPRRLSMASLASHTEHGGDATEQGDLDSMSDVAAGLFDDVLQKDLAASRSPSHGGSPRVPAGGSPSLLTTPAAESETGITLAAESEPGINGQSSVGIIARSSTHGPPRQGPAASPTHPPATAVAPNALPGLTDPHLSLPSEMAAVAAGQIPTLDTGTAQSPASGHDDLPLPARPQHQLPPRTNTPIDNTPFAGFSPEGLVQLLPPVVPEGSSHVPGLATSPPALATSPTGEGGEGTTSVLPGGSSSGNSHVTRMSQPHSVGEGGQAVQHVVLPSRAQQSHGVEGSTGAVHLSQLHQHSVTAHTPMQQPIPIRSQLLGSMGSGSHGHTITGVGSGVGSGVRSGVGSVPPSPSPSLYPVQRGLSMNSSFATVGSWGGGRQWNHPKASVPLASSTTPSFHVLGATETGAAASDAPLATSPSASRKASLPPHPSLHTTGASPPEGGGMGHIARLFAVGSTGGSGGHGPSSTSRRTSISGTPFLSQASLGSMPTTPVRPNAVARMAGTALQPPHSPITASALPPGMPSAASTPPLLSPRRSLVAAGMPDAHMAYVAGAMHHGLPLTGHPISPTNLTTGPHPHRTMTAPPHTLAPEIPGLPPGPALGEVRPRVLTHTTSHVGGGLPRVPSNQALHSALAATGQSHLLHGRSSGQGDATPRGGGWAAWTGGTVGASPSYPYSGAATPRYLMTSAPSVAASPGHGTYMHGMHGPMGCTGTSMAEHQGLGMGMGSAAWDPQDSSRLRSGMLTPGGGYPAAGGVPLAGLAPTRLHESLRLLQALEAITQERRGEIEAEIEAVVQADESVKSVAGDAEEQAVEDGVAKFVEQLEGRMEWERREAQQREELTRCVAQVERAEAECSAQRKRGDQLELDLQEAAREKSELISQLHKLRSALQHVGHVTDLQLLGVDLQSLCTLDMRRNSPEIPAQSGPAVSGATSRAAIHTVATGQPEGLQPAGGGIQEVLASMGAGEGLPLRRRSVVGGADTMPGTQDASITAASADASMGSAEQPGGDAAAMQSACRELLEDILGPPPTAIDSADLAGASPPISARVPHLQHLAGGYDSALPTPLPATTTQGASEVDIPHAPRRNPAGLALPSAPPTITPTASNRIPAAAAFGMNQSFSFNPVSPTQQRPSNILSSFSPTHQTGGIGAGVPSHPLAYDEAYFGSSGSSVYHEEGATPERHLSFMLPETSEGEGEELQLATAEPVTPATPASANPVGVVPLALDGLPFLAGDGTPGHVFFTPVGAGGAGGITPMGVGPGDQSDEGSPLVDQTSPGSSPDAASAGVPSSAEASPAQ